jgi:hypothetical protein
MYRNALSLPMFTMFITRESRKEAPPRTTLPIFYREVVDSTTWEADRSSR